MWAEMKRKKYLKTAEGESPTSVSDSDSSDDNPPRRVKVLHKKATEKQPQIDMEEQRLLMRKQAEGGPIHTPLLSTQFASLCQQVEIPPTEFQTILELVEKVEEIVSQINPNFNTRVTLFRHFYLKLGDPFVVPRSNSNQTEPLLMYLSDKSYQPLKLSPENLQQLRLSENSEFKPICEKSEDENVEGGIHLVDKQSDLKFKLVTDSVYQTEVVTCELMKYLLKFDPRARSLLILLRYWAIENDVTLNEEDTSHSPALDWMCLFYLGKEKIIPMPLKLMNRLTNGVSSVPFEEDNNLIKNWKETHKTPEEGTHNYVLNILHLATGFFDYFTSSNFRSVVLKTRDIVRDFIHGRKCQDKMYLMQPVASTLRFPVCQEKFENVVQPLMRKTLVKLNFYLKNLQENKQVAEVELKFLFQCKKENIYDIGNNFAPLEMEPDQRAAVEIADVEMEEKNKNIMNALCDCESEGSENSVGCDESSLLHKFSILMKNIIISEAEWKRREDLQKFLNSFFDKNVYPRCQLLMFRNGHLQLNNGERNDDDDLIYFCLDYPGLYSKDATGTRYVLLDNEKGGKLIDAVKTLGNYSDEAERLLLAPLVPSVIGDEEKLHVFQCEEEAFPFKFCVATPYYLPEVQASRLVQYLSTFDPRVKPLMALILRWAKINQIQLGKDDTPNLIGFAPDPSLLEWLVICYLCGKEVIPTPEEILAQHSDGKLIFDGVNIGFKMDSQYPQDWRRRRSCDAETSEEDKIVNVIELAQSFFRLWRKFGEKAKLHPRLIDLKSCRWFRKDELELEGLEINDEEAGEDLLQSNDTLKRLHSEPTISQNFFSGDEGVTILHPLYVKYGFSFCSDKFLNEICPKMWATEKKLVDMLEDYKTYMKAKVHKQKRQKLSYTLESVLLV
ncbi:unnamed protein product [Orchesella dallaii]|uniref:Uncharacterized protein n=1 Tax=Orchesella dallaii TaxID=48710 RepID=A0ABP1RMR2_9HEXA